jgi:hypothetical protein
VLKQRRRKWETVGLARRVVEEKEGVGVLAGGGGDDWQRPKAGGWGGQHLDMGGCDRTTSGRGSSTRISLSNSR